MSISLLLGDCLEQMAKLPDCSIDAIVTDPPYGISFMGRKWDYDVPSVEIWAECLRVLKPGGHLLAFAGTRTQHRMAVRIEDAGFEIRDMIAWVYGSGFPKSLDVSKAIDKHGGQSVAWFGPWFRKWREENKISQKQVASLFPSKTGGLTGCVANWELGFNMPTPEQFNLIRDTFGLPFDSIQAAEREVVGQQSGNLLAVAPGQGSDRSATTLSITAPATPEAQQWAGWGTALKPALEPITMARKPLEGTVAANVLAHGTGGLNVDGCRVASDSPPKGYPNGPGGKSHHYSSDKRSETVRPDAWEPPASGRWPANLIHDGSDEVVGLFTPGGAHGGKGGAGAIWGGGNTGGSDHGDGSTGSAARFFYCAKTSRRERGKGNNHPTVKPIALMRYLCRLVTPPGGTVLDPFMGSGSTGIAAIHEGFGFVGIERELEYMAIAQRRIDEAEARHG